MSTRFSADSSAEIWPHLNVLDDGIVKRYATTAARDADPNRAIIAVIGSGTTVQVTVYDGAAWRNIYQAPADFTPVVTASAGAFASVTGSCRWNRNGKLVTATYDVNIADAGTATGTLYASLPVVPLLLWPEHGVGRELVVTGAALVAWRQGDLCAVLGYDGQTRIASGRRFRWTLTYEAAA